MVCDGVYTYQSAGIGADYRHHSYFYSTLEQPFAGVLRVLVGAMVVEGELATDVEVVDIIVKNVLATVVVLLGMAIPEPEFVEETTSEPDALHQLPTLKPLLRVQVDSSPF
jgi:hypothetical protein